MRRSLSFHVGLMLSFIAGALLVATVILANVARLGSVIANEVRHAQNDYLQLAGYGAVAEHNALKLGQCLRREMLKLARAGFVHQDTWAVASRVQALPLCQRALSPAPQMSASDTHHPSRTAAVFVAY